jgi:hypothetical protein
MWGFQIGSIAICNDLIETLAISMFIPKSTSQTTIKVPCNHLYNQDLHYKHSILGLSTRPHKHTFLHQIHIIWGITTLSYSYMYMRNYNKWSKASKVYSNTKNTPNMCMDTNFVVPKSWETLFPSEAYRPRPIINNIFFFFFKTLLPYLLQVWII